MNFFTLFKDEERVAKVAIIVIMLALIRCLIEIFRLQSFSTIALTIENVKPFILGALSASIAVFIMILLFFYKKFKFILAVSILTISLLLILKYIYVL